MFKQYAWIIITLLVLIIGALSWESLRKILFNQDERKTEIRQSITLEEIEALGKLELVKYTFKDVIENVEEHSFLPDSKVLVVVSGEVIGCIDLSKIKEGDILETEGSVVVNLPEPELCIAKINHQDSRVYSPNNVFSGSKQAQLIDEAYKIAEKQIVIEAKKNNILEQTRSNAKKLLQPMFEKIAGSDKRVIINFQVGTQGQEIKKK